MRRAPGPQAAPAPGFFGTLGSPRASSLVLPGGFAPHLSGGWIHPSIFVASHPPRSQLCWGYRCLSLQEGYPGPPPGWAEPPSWWLQPWDRSGCCRRVEEEGFIPCM